MRASRNGPAVWSTSLVAPKEAATASFSGVDATAVTVAPRVRPSCTAASPTPPPAPSTTSSSPGTSFATDRSVWYAVRWATPNAAACRASTPSGTADTEAAATTTCSAKAPTIVLPKTLRPTSNPSTPSPRSTTVPANSLPGTKGGGTDSWYLSATMSTSGKLTAAASTRTRSCPGPRGGAGTSTTSTTSGAP